MNLDKTFCPFWEDCNSGTTCHRALTQEVKDLSVKLHRPLSHFAAKPDCWEKKNGQ